MSVVSQKEINYAALVNSVTTMLCQAQATNPQFIEDVMIAMARKGYRIKIDESFKIYVLGEHVPYTKIIYKGTTR